MKNTTSMTAADTENKNHFFFCLFSCLCSFWYNQMMKIILTVTGKTRMEFQGQVSVELRLESLIKEAHRPGFGSWAA